MSGYIHHTPGRLRLRLAQLKNRPDTARAAERTIGRMRGVVSVNANAITGSLLIHYDSRMVQAPALLAQIEQGGSQHGMMLSADASRRAAQAGAAQGASVGDRLLRAAVEKCVERFLLVLLGLSL